MQSKYININFEPEFEVTALLARMGKFKKKARDQRLVDWFEPTITVFVAATLQSHCYLFIMYVPTYKKHDKK